MTDKVKFHGLKNLDDITKDKVRSLVEDFANRIETKTKSFSKIHFNVKRIHRREKSEKYEVTAKVIGKEMLISKKTSYDIFYCIHEIFNNFLVSVAK